MLEESDSSVGQLSLLVCRWQLNPMAARMPNERYVDRITLRMVWRIKLVRRQFLIMSITVPLLVASAAFGKVSSLDDGVQLYSQGRYAEAVPFFEKAAASELRREATLGHYYLANTLMRLHRTTAALVEYEKTYELAPTTSYGVASRQVLSRYKITPAVEQAKKDAEAAAALAPPGTAADPTKPVVDLKKIQASLPKIPAPVKEKVDSGMAMGWSEADRNAYVTEAYDRRWRAADKLSDAQSLLRNAEQIVKGKVPAPEQKPDKYTEVDRGVGLVYRSVDKSRVEKAKQEVADRHAPDMRVETLLDPYRKYVADCERNLKREQSLLDSCERAREASEPTYTTRTN